MDPLSTIKKQLFEQLALVAHSIGSPQRIELLDYLAQSERTVDELSQLTQMSTANTSRHLQVLKNNGLVLVRKQGKSRIYELAGEDVVLLLKQVRLVAEAHLAEVGRLKSLLPSASSEAASFKTTLNHLNDTNYLVVDVRPHKEFQQGHIEGAIHIAPDDIESAIDTIPHDKTIIAYCRGPYCTYSHKMIEQLRKEGVEALRLENGFPEWKAAGLPVSQSI